MSDLTFIVGDCMSEMKNIKEASIDLILTDPPYGMSYQSSKKTDKKRWMPKIANDESPFIWWLFDAFRVLKDGGALITFCRFDNWSTFESAAKTAGFEVKAQLVWDKMNHGSGDLKGVPGHRHEIALFATKGRFLFHGKRPQSLIAVPRVAPAKLLHPNEKPVELMEFLVSHYCPDGGLVLDPFTGTGPVGRACKNSGRNFIGIELDEGYLDTARSRVEAKV